MSLNNLSATNTKDALFDSGNFVQNKRIISNNQILYFTDNTNGIKTGYVWKGTLPHIISTNDPRTDGGISDTAWMPIIYSGITEKMSYEGLTLNWNAHLPTVEVAYGLTKESLKIWNSGSISTENDYWLYTDGTVWNGVGILGNTPESSSGFVRINPNFNSNIKTYVATAESGQTIFNIPYTFTTVTVFVNGSLQLPTINYTVQNSTITFTSSLDLNDTVYVFVGNPNISTNDKINRIYTSIAEQGQTELQVPYDFSTAIVYINGVLQNPTSSYSIGADRIITFAEGLYQDDEIIIMLGDIIIQSDDYILKTEIENIIDEELSKSSTAEKIGIYPQGTLQKALNYITFEMFGAIGDGVTDDTVAIKNTIANSNGRYISTTGNKTYKLTDTIQVTCNIIGDGTNIFIQTTDSKSCFDIITDNITITGINVTPASVVSSSLQFAGIVIKNSNNCIVDKCNVLYAGRTDREGSGIGIYNGSNNIISNCKASGANLSPGTRHDYGGNDFFVYGNSSRNKIYKNIGIGSNIRGIMQQTTVLGQKCNYNEYDSNTSIGHIGYGHLCYELNHDSTTEMIGTTFRNGFVANITGSATDPSSGLKYFGAGVYNQEGQDTRIENYYIYNVCQDTNIQQTLPMAGISSTRGDIRIQNNFISLSKRAGIKISTSNIGGDERTAIITNNTIKNSSDEALYLVNTNRSIINGLNVVNSGRVIRASSNSSYTSSNITIDNVTASGSIGILLDGFSSAIVNNCNGDNCTTFFTAQNINYLLASKIVSNSDTSTGINISSTVSSGFLRDSVSINGVTGFNLAAKIVYEKLIGKNNTTNFTGTYSGITTLSTTSTIDVENLKFVAIGAGSDITTITGGVTNQVIIIRATAARNIIHNSTLIILKSGGTLSMTANNTVQLWCIDGTRWLEI